jgi:L-threonylcarbamoyladenylate synthase
VSALLVADLSMLAELCLDVPERARQLALEHWPGPLTLALPARPHLPSAIVCEGCVAARVSSHPLAHALVAGVGRPITSTSANPSGCPPVRCPEDIGSLFPARGLHILDGGAAPGGPSSTVVRVRRGAIEILRRGAVELSPPG